MNRSASTNTYHLYRSVTRQTPSKLPAISFVQQISQPRLMSRMSYAGIVWPTEKNLAKMFCKLQPPCTMLGMRWKKYAHASPTATTYLPIPTLLHTGSTSDRRQQLPLFAVTRLSQYYPWFPLRTQTLPLARDASLWIQRPVGPRWPRKIIRFKPDASRNPDKRKLGGSGTLELLMKTCWSSVFHVHYALACRGVTRALRFCVICEKFQFYHVL